MTTKIEQTRLYQIFSQRLISSTIVPSNMLALFNQLRERLEAEGKYIVAVFPEYTPHDWVDHISNLFSLADRILGSNLFERLNSAELTLLVFGLVAHDWGMAVSESELAALKDGGEVCSSSFVLLPGEPQSALRYVALADETGVPLDVAWREYLRETSGLRSGARLRNFLEQFSSVFSEAVAKIAEGHTLNTSDIRDPSRYPISMSVFGESVNLAAIATYVRIVDLLDIGEDRTPYALWRFISPKDRVSKMHWDRHRALSPISVKQGDIFRRIVITGSTSDPHTYAAIADLQSWVDVQFEESINTLRTSNSIYDIDLDSRIGWTIHAVGFEPLVLRFELDRNRILQLLSDELYDRDPLVFVRELLQNSVDAIDAREAILRGECASLKGEIDILISTGTEGLRLEWKDNGIGMDEKILKSFFCQVGQSWYQSREAKRLKGFDAISQFGIGFLSCFSVSDQIEIETRRDPNISENRSGLLINIPSRSSHFSVLKVSDIPIGTSVRMMINSTHSKYFSASALCNAIVRISRFVRHRIKIHVDGQVLHAGYLSEENTAGLFDGDIVTHIKGSAAKIIYKNTDIIDIKIGNIGELYSGYYRAIFPRDPSNVEESIDYKSWILAGEKVVLNDVLISNEESMFLKGIQVGAVSPGVRLRDYVETFLTHSKWISPSLLLNLVEPSLVAINLSRSAINLKSEELRLTIQSDIAKKLAASIFGGLGQGPEKDAQLLGGLACFGGIPTEVLSYLLPPEEIPILVLGSNRGLHWRRLGDFTCGDEFLEAPFEIEYAWGNQYGSKSIEISQDFQWGGHDVLVTKLSSMKHPWLSYALIIAHKVITRLGWQPTTIYPVTPPSEEQLPLICRKWMPIAAAQTTNENINNLSIFSAWDSDAPQLVKFPDIFNHYAAFGSRYWNLSNKKIKAISNVLNELRRQFSDGVLSDAAMRKYQYLTSHDFYGYIVPSRLSNTTVALLLPNNLLDLANENGLSIEYRLEESDFYPGTIGEYRNPYHYPLKSWVSSERVFGGTWPLSDA
ncbi:HD domain-containing protein [Leeia oryzae]|uniref:HD domain-containing protein n=1 Tax=Leeia oryzae TaxID=356662 RepID=UPI0003A2762C|nr:ATP-binding protein [Leeia oryzae]